MAARKIMSLSAEQESKFGLYVDRWKQIGLSTAPIDRGKHDRHVAAVYRLAKLDAPRMIYTPCPLSGALAASIYAAITRNSAVRSAVRSAVDSAVGSAVGSAVRSAVRMFKQDEFISYLEVKKPATVRHLRSFDTHSPITLPPGKYRVTRQREYVPEGFRLAAD